MAQAALALVRPSRDQQLLAEAAVVVLLAQRLEAQGGQAAAAQALELVKVMDLPQLLTQAVVVVDQEALVAVQAALASLL